MIFEFSYSAVIRCVKDFPIGCKWQSFSYYGQCLFNCVHKCLTVIIMMKTHQGRINVKPKCLTSTERNARRNVSVFNGKCASGVKREAFPRIHSRNLLNHFWKSAMHFILCHQNDKNRQRRLNWVLRGCLKLCIVFTFFLLNTLEQETWCLLHFYLRFEAKH